MARHQVRMYRSLHALILARQGGLCWYCKRKIRYRVVARHCHNQQHPLYPTGDHRHPIALGGEYYGDNLVVACRECNCRKGALPESVYLMVRNNRVMLKQAHMAVQRLLEEMTSEERVALRYRGEENKADSLKALHLSLGPVVRSLRAAGGMI